MIEPDVGMVIIVSQMLTSSCPDVAIFDRQILAAT